jgi:hypothetical protein
MTATCEQALKSCLVQVAKGRGIEKSPQTLALTVFLVAAIGGLVGCGGGSGSTTVKTVAITPTSASVSIAGQTQFTAVVTLVNSTTSTTTTVTWDVDGVAGGNASCGTIAPLSTDQLVGVYTAPATVPTSSCGSALQLGQVAITATASQTTTTSSSGLVTSNTAIVTIGVVLGLSVSPPSAAVPAGGTQQFSALLNGVASGATWSLTSSSEGGNLGSIDSTGLYTAPPFPPPGNSLTVTAAATGSNGTSVTATASVTIAYSDRSLSGPYAFSYTGNDGSGFFAVAGSFVADGNGTIVSGVEDIQSFLTGVSTEVPITTSTYVVGSDGRGSALIKTNRGTNTWRFVLSTNLHAQLTRFDTNITGGGSIDQQSLGAVTTSLSAISGRYAFATLGTDAQPNYNPLGMAGEFLADGAGNIPNTDAILDVNDNGIAGGTVTRGDTTLNGSYAFDTAFAGTGRGTLTLESATTATRTFAFYTVTTSPPNTQIVAQLHLVEIDGITFTAGDVFLAATSPGLANATYVLTTGGNSSGGAYAAGGFFQSDGVSTTSNGVLDINNAGSYNMGPSLGSCTFTVDATTGRIDLGLFVGSGTCSSISSSGVSEFAAYATSFGSLVLLELDSSAVSAGLAYQQCGPESAGCAAASPALSAIGIALGLNGQGLFHSPPATSASYQSDLVGQITVSSTTASGGNLDINNFSGTFPADPIGTTGSMIGSPAANGRGTITLTPTNPAVAYSLVYYLIADNTGLLFSSGQNLVATGAIARQY